VQGQSIALHPDQVVAVRWYSEAFCSGISRAALSKIERGEMSPTYESLLKVAQGLKTDLGALVLRPAAKGRDGFIITRAGEGAKYRQAQFIHEFLAVGFQDRKLHAFVTAVPAVSLSDLQRHRREARNRFTHCRDCYCCGCVSAVWLHAS
jgi:transcriptional regulator with XRE-family HTH domain